MKRITVPEEGIETLFGSYDENLKHFESLFNVRIRTHGHDLLVEGESPNLDKVDRMVDQLSSLVRDGYKLSNADVKTASALSRRHRSSRHRVRHRAGGNREDVPRDGAGGDVSRRQESDPHHPRASGRRSGGETGVPAWRFAGKSESVPAAAVRRAV